MIIENRKLNLALRKSLGTITSVFNGMWGRKRSGIQIIGDATEELEPMRTDFISEDKQQKGGSRYGRFGRILNTCINLKAKSQIVERNLRHRKKNKGNLCCRLQSGMWYFISIELLSWER